MRRMPPRLFPAVLALSLAFATAGLEHPSIATASTPPNIILILTDDQTYDSIPHTPAVMPYLQGRIQDSTDHWITFPHTFFNTPLCCPSRSTILTGRYSSHTKVVNNKLGRKLDESSTIATWLHSADYYTGFVGKYLNSYPFGRGNYTPPGWDHFVAFNEDEDKYYNYSLNVEGTTFNYGSTAADYSTDVLAQFGLDFLSNAPTDQPYFLMWAPRAPHPPSTVAPRDTGIYNGYAPTRYPSFNEADISDKPPWMQSLLLAGPTLIKKWDANRLKAYEALVPVDEAVHELLDEVASRGDLDNTVVIYMTDNGYSYGEHRVIAKGVPYDQADATPFFVRYPGATMQSVPALISNVDVAPTIADLAGATPTISEDGQSFAGFVDGNRPSNWPDEMLVALPKGGGAIPAYWAVRSLDYLYVEYADGSKELYDLKGELGPPDPDAMENRAGQPAYADVQSSLANHLAQLKLEAN